MHRFKKRFGQHFLRDVTVIDKIVASTDLSPNDEVWEVGGGEGVLTEALLKFGVNLTVFEIDYDLQGVLEEKFADKISLVKSDVLKQNWDEILSERVKVVANLPYNITSPFLFKVIKNIDYFSSLTVMIQKEVAQRIVAAPGDKKYGRLSLKMQFYFEVKKLFDVPSGSFYPPPKVDSSVIRAVPRANRPKVVDLDLYMKIVDLAFSNRRKMLRVNLKPLLSKEQIQKLDFDLTLRGEKLSENDFVELTRQVKQVL